MFEKIISLGKNPLSLSLAFLNQTLKEELVNVFSGGALSKEKYSRAILGLPEEPFMLLSHSRSPTLLQS